MLLKEKIIEAIELSQKIPKYDAFDEGTMNHFNISLREIKRFAYDERISPDLVIEIEKILIIHPENIDKEIGHINFLDRLTINRFGGPRYSFESFFSKRDIQKRAYVLRNNFQLQKLLHLIK